MSSFITTEATQDVFELVLARPVKTPTGEHGSLVHLWWRAPGQGQRLVQVYVNGTLYDVTQDTSVREMFLVLDRTRPIQIELLAVPVENPDAIWRPQPELLKSWQPTTQSSVHVELVRDENFPVDTQVEVAIDGAVVDAGPMWPATEARCGAYSETGPLFTESYGRGLGIGGLGAGPLGYDASAWQWLRDDLTAGEYDVQITGMHPSGEPATLQTHLSQTIDRLAAPVDHFRISNQTSLAWDVES